MSLLDDIDEFASEPVSCSDAFPAKVEAFFFKVEAEIGEKG